MQRGAWRGKPSRSDSGSLQRPWSSFREVFGQTLIARKLVSGVVGMAVYWPASCMGWFFPALYRTYLLRLTGVYCWLWKTRLLLSVYVTRIICWLHSNSEVLYTCMPSGTECSRLQLHQLVSSLTTQAAHMILLIVTNTYNYLFCIYIRTSTCTQWL